MRWKKVTLVGVGLLGGSLGFALKRRGLADEVVGFVRRESSVKECEKLGAVDKATLDLISAVAGADLIIFCTPIGQMKQLMRDSMDALRPGAIITDVGSVKATVVKQLESLASAANAHFVGSHPMAGAEKTGVAAARADLFSGAVCVVTPTRKANRTAVRRLEALWTALGSRVIRLNPSVHDELVSRSSHLPHVLAAELARLVLNSKYPKEQRLLCANGFRDTTRIASGSPEMWRDIALANRKNLVRALDSYMANLKAFRKSLAAGDDLAISKFFQSAKRRRDAWSANGASPSPE